MSKIKSDLARLDAHELTAEELEEAPELTDEQLRDATVNGANRRPPRAHRARDRHHRSRPGHD